MLDSNGQKQVVLPGDGEYKVVYKATGDGTMTISTSKYLQTEALPESVTGYYELPLKAGETYEAMITGSNFVLTDSTKTTVNPSVVQTGAEVKTYKVDIAVQGNGEATGINTYSVGEFAKVCAHPNAGEKFLGWYENGNLISGEVEYCFCVKKDTTLIAKFTGNSQGEQNVAVGKLYKVNKHTYKVTSVKKKTVSFVKTASKAKSIKIPATVTIQGTKYKVTSIAANALKGNKKVTKLTIGKNVTSIGKKAFYNCKKLKSVTIKTTKMKSVGKYAFKGIAKQATIKCPAKKLKKYKKILKKSKMTKTVQVK